MTARPTITVLLFSSWLFTACGGGPDADRLGVAAECSSTSDCPEVEIDGEKTQLQCLTQFTAGYCAIEDCDNALDCPEGATCVAHEGINYCFRECADKAECNRNRSPANEANCSANFEYADERDDVAGLKACIPPSSG